MNTIEQLVNIYLATLDATRPSPLGLSKFVRKVAPQLGPESVVLAWSIVFIRLSRV
jgi:hypothetical protein